MRSQVIAFSSDQPRWSAYVNHLERVDMARWVVTPEGAALPGIHYLGIARDEDVIGHLTLIVQPLATPGTPGSASALLSAPDGVPLTEAFVQTFAVEPDYRRQGHGRALQEAALALAGRLGCYQMRSWSSLDKTANYALKIRLGFATCPAIYTTSSGQSIPGVYFVKGCR